MTTELRNPKLDPWHPNEQVRRNNVHAAVAQHRDRVVGAIGLLRRCIGGAPLTKDEKSSALVFLDALSRVAGVDDHLGFQLVQAQKDVRQAQLVAAEAAQALAK